ncbi:hypothetical protein FJZ19_03540 [Candidatus Pacearchaeota archaeon]|nr:hypothetical protein [Candidatus Pacearchaeota archaeon]
MAEKELQIYWTREKGIHYINGGTIITEAEARERAGRKEYARITTGWDEMIPVDEFIRMQDAKSELEEISSK